MEVAADALGSLAVDHPFVAAEESAEEDEGWEVWEDAQEEGAEEVMEGDEEKPWDAAIIRSSPEPHVVPPWKRPRGKSMVSLVHSDTKATRIGWHLWEIDLRFAFHSTPGWLTPPTARMQARGWGFSRFSFLLLNYA